MNYKITVIGVDGEPLASETADDRPSEDYLRDFARRSGGVFCDICRLDLADCPL